MTEFNPNQFIDREFEQELFEELLQPTDPARVLAIQDGGGTGKSHLLQRFRYRCAVANKPRIPVGLVYLDTLTDPTTFGLMLHLYEELNRFRLIPFDRFRPLNEVRKRERFDVIQQSSINLHGADLTGAQADIAMSMTKIQQAEQVTISGQFSFTPEQKAQAQTMCVQAFWQDVVAYCQTNPVVILLDALERCDATLREWLIHDLLLPYCFDPDHRPAHLLTVIAGQSLPDFTHHWHPDDCRQTVKSVTQLGKWTQEHVAECLRIHDISYTEDDIMAFYHLLQRGITPMHVVGLIKQMSGRNP